MATEQSASQAPLDGVSHRFKSDDQMLTASALDSRLVKDILRRCRARYKLLVLDCCHAGGAHPGLRGQQELKALLRDTLQGSGSAILSACAKGRQTREREIFDGGAGFLTWAITSACTEAGHNGGLSLGALWKCVLALRDKVNATLSGDDQIPLHLLWTESAGGGEIWFTPQRREDPSKREDTEWQEREDWHRADFLQQYCRARIEEFDQVKVLAHAASQSDADRLNTEDVQDLCRQLGLASALGTPTHAAVLAFHRNPERCIPSALVRTTLETAIAEPYTITDITGSLSEQAEKTILWIKGKLETISEQVGAQERDDYLPKFGPK